MLIPTVLILCTGNSCRSHMAQGVLQSIVGDKLRVFSAGTEPAGYVHPLAIKVMQEIGIDISDHKSRHVDEYKGETIHAVMTVCGDAHENCPVFPGDVKRFHWGFRDPAKAVGTDEDILAEFRKVRDQIKMVFEVYGEGYLQGLKDGTYGPES